MILLRSCFDVLSLCMLLIFLEVIIVSCRLFGGQSLQHAGYLLHGNHLVLALWIGNALVKLAFLEGILAVVKVLLLLD